MKMKMQHYIGCPSTSGTKWLMSTEPVACTMSVIDHMMVILRSPQSVRRLSSQLNDVVSNSSTVFCAVTYG